MTAGTMQADTEKIKDSERSIISCYQLTEIVKKNLDLHVWKHGFDINYSF